MTVFGAFLTVLLLVSLLLPYKWTFALLVVMCPFHATSALVVSGKYVQPYVFCELMLIMRSFLGRGAPLDMRRDRGTYETVTFLMIWGIIITFFGPQFFEGMKVVQKALDDALLHGLVRLHFGMNNVTQIAYLLVNLMTIMCVVKNRRLIGWEFARKAFLGAAVVSVFFGFWEYFSKITGAIPFPKEILFNSGEMYKEERMAALCLEASYFGGFVGAAVWALAGMRNSGIYVKILLVLTALCVIFNRSGTGIMTFLCGGFIFLYLKGIRPKYLLMGASVALLGVLLAVQLGMWESLYTGISEKSDSQSGEVRLFTTMCNFKIFFQTCGAGVGLGSTRSSSFLADEMACLGFIGTLLMARIFYLFGWKRKRQLDVQYIFLYVFCVLAAQCMSVPDFSYCYFWMGMFVAAASIPFESCTEEDEEEEEEEVNLAALEVT